MEMEWNRMVFTKKTRKSTKKNERAIETKHVTLQQRIKEKY